MHEQHYVSPTNFIYFNHVFLVLSHLIMIIGSFTNNFKTGVLKYVIKNSRHIYPQPGSLWLSRQTGPISSDVTRNSGTQANNLSKYNPLSLAKGSLAPPHSTPSFDIWRGGPPGRQTNRPTWQVPLGPVRPCPQQRKSVKRTLASESNATSSYIASWLIGTYHAL